MKKIRAALEWVKKALSLSHRLLARAQRRYKANRKRAFIADNQRERAQVRADDLRAEGRVAAADRKDAEVRRHSHVAYRNHLRAQHYLGVVKRLQQRIHGLKTKAEHFEAEIKKNKAKAKEIDGNLVVRGGSRRQRLRCAIHAAAANCAKGIQSNYYSMSGLARLYLKVLAGYLSGHIWDCSTFADGIYIVCDLEAPSGPRTQELGGWTGPQGEHGERVAKSKAQTGDLVLYGPAPHHHVEVVDDPVEESTIGHGSAPIDAAKFDLFGGGRCAEPGGPGPSSMADYEIRSYL